MDFFLGYPQKSLQKEYSTRQYIEAVMNESNNRCVLLIAKEVAYEFSWTEQKWK
jgi:hypothetical protein